jgi:hypothetical protein
MPEKKTIARARKKAREGKAPTTQAGEFVREEMEHVKQGKHGAKSRKQTIAIGLSKARRAGVQLPSPKKGKYPEATREKAERESKRARRAGKSITGSKRPSRKSGAKKGTARHRREHSKAGGRT